jgi:hypothetical protein
MELVAMILGWIAGLVHIVCFIIVLVKMFKSGQTVLAIACILLVCCAGIGFLVAFVVGWMRVREWNIMPVMIAWSVVWVVSLISYGLNPSAYSHQLQQIQQPGH